MAWSTGYSGMEWMDFEEFASVAVMCNETVLILVGCVGFVGKMAIVSPHSISLKKLNDNCYLQCMLIREQLWMQVASVHHEYGRLTLPTAGLLFSLQCWQVCLG